MKNLIVCFLLCSCFLISCGDTKKGSAPDTTGTVARPAQVNPPPMPPPPGNIDGTPYGLVGQFFNGAETPVTLRLTYLNNTQEDYFMAIKVFTSDNESTRLLRESPFIPVPHPIVPGPAITNTITLPASPNDRNLWVVGVYKKTPADIIKAFMCGTPVTGGHFTLGTDNTVRTGIMVDAQGVSDTSFVQPPPPINRMAAPVKH